MRTTLDLDGPVLRELKRLQKVERKSLGRLVSDLVAHALASRKARQPAPAPFQWVSRSMGPRVDLADKEAVRALLDREPGITLASSSRS